MAVQTSYPGVYVQEVPSGVRTITGVSTSTALFIGASLRGPINKPVRCVNYTTFKNAFGESFSAGGLAQYVKLFFLNGGSDCYVMRIAEGAAPSEVTLKSETAASVLRLVAKDAGTQGAFLRARVSYRGSRPEASFNLELFRWELNSAGTMTKTFQELWPDLSFDPNSPRYVETFLNQNSTLVNADDLTAAVLPATIFGSSYSGRAVGDATAGTNKFKTVWETLLGSMVPTNTFQISVGGRVYVNVNLGAFVVTNTPGDLETFIENAVANAYVAAGIPGVTVDATIDGPVTARRLKITATGSNGDVFIQPGIPEAGRTDLAVKLMLGTEQGGIEISGFADRRPAPNGITFRAADIANVNHFTTFTQDKFTQISLESILNNALVLQPVAAGSVQTTGAADPFTRDAYPSPRNGNSDGIREKFQIVADLINNFSPPPLHRWPWKAEVSGYRLTILPKSDEDENLLSVGATFVTAPALPGTALTKNVLYYALNTTGAGLFQTAGANGNDGTAPNSITYDLAYAIVEKEIDLFNLLVLPPVESPATPLTDLYGNASAFCRKKRAFLIMDPPKTWTNVQVASTGVAALRVGLVKDYSAVFFPDIVIKENELKKNIGPAGALAGLFARTDSTRGVWKAPAGIEADLLGVVGLQQLLSDAENGILNPLAINTLRSFPSGIVSWGARTNFGDDSTPHDYKYIPVRRTALYIEESLYRGLKWVVFEPNDEPLWAQIRLNVGAFMHNLFRQGAFQGTKKNDAYFVKCDSETTTQNDINLGIVNIWVGFAPLKPAEFVVLYLQQMAGNILV